MACDCLARFQDRLEKHNTRLCESFYAGVLQPTVTLEVEQISRDGPPAANVVALFCPFCGERYDEPPSGAWKGRSAGDRHAH